MHQLMTMKSNSTICRYADDHTLTVSFRADTLDKEDERRCIANLESSMLDIKSWMDEKKLKMNSRIEFIFFSQQQQKKTTLIKCGTRYS